MKSWHCPVDIDVTSTSPLICTSSGSSNINKAPVMSVITTYVSILVALQLQNV